MTNGWNSFDRLFMFLIAIIQGRSETIVYVDRGQSVILFCNITPSSWPTWDGPGKHGSNFSTYADKSNINSQLSNAHKIEIKGNISAGEYNLKLNNISSEEEGFYRCTEFVNEGTPLETTTVILLIKEAPWNITINNSNNRVLKAEENRTLVLFCNVNYASMESIMWFNGSILLGVGGPMVFLFEIIPQRYDHNKTFTCAVNSSKVRPASNKSIMLDIQYKPVVTLNIDQIIRIQEGQNFTLSCIVDSNPAATRVYFEKDGFSIDVSNLTNSLNLFNIRREQTGTYGCKAENVIGKGYTDVKLIVQWSVCLLFMKYIRYPRRHTDIQQVPNGRQYDEIGTLTSHGLNLGTMPTSSEHNVPERDMSLQNIRNDNETSSESDCSDDGSTLSVQEQHVPRYENAYQPLDISGSEIHVYNETCIFNANNSSNYLNTHIFNTNL
ncbi:unnamed protein product [Mytilus edulis]|uniref:Ig-like domain-containing protein n=1 Tax=Mytilus edulis TaxID=6550 RepID=A0A8S3UG53_MYTED|nr:unnamed protein product [Mytilus edulis]